MSELAIEWAADQPDNYRNSEHCLVMMLTKNATMNDINCKEVFPYVCYKKKKELEVNKCATTDLGMYLHIIPQILNAIITPFFKLKIFFIH